MSLSETSIIHILLFISAEVLAFIGMWVHLHVRIKGLEVTLETLEKYRDDMERARLDADNRYSTAMMVLNEEIKRLTARLDVVIARMEEREKHQPTHR